MHKKIDLFFVCLFNFYGLVEIILCFCVYFCWTSQYKNDRSTLFFSLRSSFHRRLTRTRKSRKIGPVLRTFIPRLLVLRAFSVQIINKHTFSSIFWPHISLFLLFLNSTPKKGGGGGAHSPCLFIFLLGHAHIWPKRGGHVPEMPPPPLDPMLPDYGSITMSACSIILTFSFRSKCKQVEHYIA